MILDPTIEAEIARVRLAAETMPILSAQMAEMLTGRKAVGDNPAFVVHIPMGFRAVFSIEEQMAGLCRHLSVSVNANGRVPHPEAIKMLMPLFGFTKRLEECHVGLERPDAANPDFAAVNVVEIIRPH